MRRPTVARITEADPRMRRIHVVGEVHPGELAERGYVRRGEEWVLDVRRPATPGHDADPFVAEFDALSRMGYDFAEGDEWSPRELLGRLRREKP
ncbi:MAG TPA: hypothetical protein VJB14_09760 [Planctomycetota bacterium]|nr:hypothetical protein [Planctomycetota bacterium]